MTIASPSVRRRWALVFVAGVVLLGAIPTLTPLGSSSGLGMAGWSTLVAFVGAVIVGELLVLRPPRSRPLPASPAVLAALALIGGSPAEVVMVALLGWAGASLLRTWRDGLPHHEVPLQRLTAGWGIAGIAAIAHELPGADAFLVGGGPAADASADGAVSWVAILAVTAGLVVGGALWSAVVTERPDGSVWHLFVPEVRVSWASNLVLGSGAALAAVTYGMFGPGGLALLLAAVLAVRGGLERHGEVGRMYDETVVAMSRMAELAGHVPPGHGVRVAEVAAGVARTLGLSEREVAAVIRAGHLHEVGRISIDDPREASDEEEVALAGASIVREAGDMESVAALIERQRDPYRIPGTSDDGTLPLSARIVRSVCEYDRMVAERGSPSSSALDELRRSMAYDHDPAVVRALAVHLDRS